MVWPATTQMEAHRVTNDGRRVGLRIIRNHMSYVLPPHRNIRVDKEGTIYLDGKKWVPRVEDGEPFHRVASRGFFC